MKIIILNERPMSWNVLYSGKHWSVRKDEADRVHQLVKAFIGPRTFIYTSYVVILFDIYFDKRVLDPDNVAIKFYIDALKGTILKDDTWKDIYSVTTHCEKDPNNPRVEININERF